MKKVITLVTILLILSSIVLYATETNNALRVYYRKKGVNYYEVIPFNQIISLEWHDDKKKILVKTPLIKCGFYIPRKDETEALKLIEKVVGNKSKNWINVDGEDFDWK